MKLLKGHVVRWVIILMMGGFIFFGTFSMQPWSPEGAIQETLQAMEMPGDVKAVSQIEAGKRISVIFWDEAHEMYHHSWMSRTLGLLWMPRGGGFGHTFQEEEWKIRFGEGFSRQGNGAYHYVIGQVNDPEIAEVEVLWRDGTKEVMEPVMGKLIHFAREGQPGESAYISVGLNAYDSDGELLYELDHDQNFIRVD